MCYSAWMLEKLTVTVSWCVKYDGEESRKRAICSKFSSTISESKEFKI
jgi:hypothetical protein